MKLFIIKIVFITCLIIYPLNYLHAEILNQSSIWNSAVNEETQQLTINGKENGINVSIILKPNEPPILQISFLKNEHNFNNDTVKFSINNYVITLLKNSIDDNSETLNYQYTIQPEKLKKFIHLLTSKKEALISLKDQATPISLHGTSASVSAILKYVEDNHIDHLNAPFNIENHVPSTSHDTVTQNQDTATNNPTPSKKPKEDEGTASGIIALLILFAYPIYRFIIKPAYKNLVQPFLQDIAESKRKKIYDEQVKKTQAICYEEVEKQAQKLYIKYNQLIYKDDYGTIQYQRWNNEIARFIKSRIEPLIIQHNLSSYYPAISEALVRKIYEVALTPQTINEEVSNELAIGSDNYHPNMNPYDYEAFCAKLLRKIGWEAQATVASGDQGADVIATKDGVTLILQCKLYSSPVGNKAVQEINTARTYYHADYAAVVSNSTYTTSARQIALSTKVELLHHDELQHYAHSLESKT